MAAVPVTAGAVKGWNGNRSFAIWAGFGDADLCRRRRGEVLAARRTFELELHRHQIFVQEKFILTVCQQSVRAQTHSWAAWLIKEICCEIVAKLRNVIDLRERSLRGSNPQPPP